jgi:hypothetical protein
VALLEFHSLHSAIIGFTRIAHQAGTRQATSAMLKTAASAGRNNRAPYPPKEGYFFERKTVQPFLNSIRRGGGERFQKG